MSSNACNVTLLQLQTQQGRYALRKQFVLFGVLFHSQPQQQRGGMPCFFPLKRMLSKAWKPSRLGRYPTPFLKQDGRTIILFADASFNITKFRNTYYVYPGDTHKDILSKASKRARLPTATHLRSNSRPVNFPLIEVLVHMQEELFQSWQLPGFLEQIRISSHQSRGHIWKWVNKPLES